MLLTADDFGRWTDALSELPHPGGNCMAWVIGPLRRFFPFERVYMAHGMLVAGEVTVTHWQADGHDEPYLLQQARTFELEKRGALAWWLANREPFLIDPTRPPPFASRFELDEITTFGLQNVAAHGVLNLKANAGTYFSFCGVKHPTSDWHLDALRILTPVLNDLYLAQIAIGDGESLPLERLSARQRAIIRRVVDGQDDKTIARELGIAPQTVKNLLCVTYQQLNIRTRAQLISLLR